jgi:RND family efflux transporter MFP subunit
MMNIERGEDGLPGENEGTASPARPRRHIRNVVLGLAVAVGVGITVWVVGMSSDKVAVSATTMQASAPIELLPSDVARASVRELQRSIPITGTLQPLNQTEIKSQQAAEIREVLVRAGEPVRRGQVLAKLDSSDLAARLQDKLGALEVGEAQRQLARGNLTKNESLLKENFISQAAFDNIRNSHQVSEATLVSLRAQVQQARKGLAEAVIRSPIDGVVAERVAQPGLAVATNAKLFTVQDLSVMNVEAPVPASDIPSVKIGQEARLNIEGFGERVFVGKVDRINPSTEKDTRSIIVHLRVANQEGQLRGGTFAQGTLGLSQPVVALMVPQEAIHPRNGQASVFRIENGEVRETAVQTGQSDPGSGGIEITSGLAEGAQVVVSRVANLVSGQSIRIAALSAPGR